MTHIRTHFLSAFTLSILLFGTLAILEVLSGRFVLAAQLIIIAAMLDGVDGTLARNLNAESEFGARLDTYVDIVCFGVAPALLAYQGLCSGHYPGATFVVFAIILSGVVRFARGCERTMASGGHGFRGLPIPVSAVWIALFAILQHSSATTGRTFAPHIELSISTFMWLCTATLLVLQISNIPYAKPRRQHVGFGIVIVVILGALTRQPLLVMGCTTGVGVILYTIVNPLYERHALAHRTPDSLTANG